MATYSDDSLLRRLYVDINDYLAGNFDFTTEREVAYAWVNDKLRATLSVPISTPSRLL